MPGISSSSDLATGLISEADRDLERVEMVETYLLLLLNVSRGLMSPYCHVYTHCNATAALRAFLENDTVNVFQFTSSSLDPCSSPHQKIRGGCVTQNLDNEIFGSRPQVSPELFQGRYLAHSDTLV